jgi:hypothetical protein
MDRATWSKRVASWKRSGLSADEFAARQREAPFDVANKTTSEQHVG